MAIPGIKQIPGNHQNVVSSHEGTEGHPGVDAAVDVCSDQKFHVQNGVLIYMMEMFWWLMRSLSFPEHLKVTTRRAGSVISWSVAGFRPFLAFFH